MARKRKQSSFTKKTGKVTSYRKVMRKDLYPNSSSNTNMEDPTEPSAEELDDIVEASTPHFETDPLILQRKRDGIIE